MRRLDSFTAGVSPPRGVPNETDSPKRDNYNHCGVAIVSVKRPSGSWRVPSSAA
jgi:hypothetical protein